jgi:DNA gyrase subunit A
VNLVQISSTDEKITAAIPIRSFEDEKESYLIMCTRQGTIKKTPLSEFENPRKGGIIAMGLEKEDVLIEVKHTDGKSEIIIATKEGMAIRFKEKEIRIIGRGGKGVRGIKLNKDDVVVGMETVSAKDIFLTASENGYGKRTEVGKGVRNMKTNDRNGSVIGIKEANDDGELMLMTQKGITIRLPVKDINVIGRNVQGVRLVRLEEGDKLAAIATVLKEAEAGEENGKPEEKK